MSRLNFCKTINCNQGAVRAVRYSIDGSYCLTCGSDKKIKLWNPYTEILLKTYGGHADEVTDVAGSSDSCNIVSSSLDKSIIYWDVTTGQPIRRLRSHAGGVTCVRFNEDSSIAVSGSRDNSVMCWDIRTRKLEPIQIMKDAKDCITSLIVTNDKIISTSLDGCVRYYDIRIGELLCYQIHEPITYAVQTKNEQCIVASCADDVIKLIDNDDGSILSEYKGHITNNYRIECGVLSDYTQIISGSVGGYAIVWDLLESKELYRIQIGNDSPVHSLITHPTSTDVIFAKKQDIHIFKS